MAAPALILGQIAAPLLPHLLRFAHEKAIPMVNNILSDPGGFVSRIGDLIVWNGSGGQKILAGLQTLGESQQRIEQAITSIESTQLSTLATLTSMQAVSFATFGVASLAGSLTLWRLDALNKRFDRLSQSVRDLEENLDAQNKAHLRNAVQKLREFDDTENTSTLVRARDEAQHATNVYGQLTHRECQSSKPRLTVLNYRGRCYLLSLVTELRARLLDNQQKEAIARFSEEKNTIELFAKATFQAAINNEPSSFLSEEMKSQGTTLDLMTEIYQTAQRLGAFTEARINTPNDMFEYCRTTGISGKPYFTWTKQPQNDLANRLKYLLACFEDIGRAESLKMLAVELNGKKASYESLQKQLRAHTEEKAKDHDPESVFAYSFA